MEYRLEELFDLQMGKTPSRNNNDYWRDEGNKWISISDLSQCGKYISMTKERISDKAVEETGIREIPANTVIMSFKLSIGKTAITSEPMYSNEAIMAFHDKHIANLIPDYIYYMFSGKDWNEGTNKAVLGKTLNKATLSKVKVNVCDIDKQRSIVDILDKVSSILESRKKELRMMDELIKARFAELFGDLKTVNTWKQEKISVVCNEIVDCVNKTAPVVDSVTPYKMLRTTNIRNGRVDVCNVKYVEEAAYKKWTRRSVPQRGDILLTREAPVGEVGVIDSDDKVFLGQRLVSYRVNPEKMDEVFLLYQMMSPFFQDELVGVAKGSTVKHIPVPVCTEFIVHVPPLELQKQFSGFVKQVDKSKLLEAQQAGFIAKTRPTNTILSIG